jgi:hypothetical protein
MDVALAQPVVDAVHGALVNASPIVHIYARLRDHIRHGVLLMFDIGPTLRARDTGAAQRHGKSG